MIKTKVQMFLARTKEKFSKKEYVVYKGYIYSELLYTNNYINLIYEAGKECYAGKKTHLVEDKVKFIRLRVKEQHESILEHSNIITGYYVPLKYEKELVEILSLCKYLNVKVTKTEVDFRVVLAGSARGYKHIFRYIKHPDNIILGSIKQLMYNIHSSLFADFIEDDIMNESYFMDSVAEATTSARGDLDIHKEENYSFTIYNQDNIHAKVNGHNNEPINEILKRDYKLDDLDLLELFTITIYFEDMSRIITQMLTRHRNGITQLSQRYVDYSNKSFNAPYKYKPEKYNKDDKYKIDIFGTSVELTQDELGSQLISIYNQLIKQGLLKEDARAYLPGNTVSSLFVTFTFFNLIKFLKLRTEKHAQAEIRIVSNAIANLVDSGKIELLDLEEHKSCDTLYEWIDSRYKYEEIKDIAYDDIDEIIE